MDNSFLNSRRDLQIVSRLIEPDSRILDLGCGDGSFLAYLKQLKNASVLGLELEQSQIGQCIANGVPVGGDLEYTDEITLGRSIVNRIEFRL